MSSLSLLGGEERSHPTAPLAESLAPGSRVRIRGEEWAVEKCLPLPMGGYAVHVQGLSELVARHKAIFLDTLDAIEQLRPEATELVMDDSPEYRQTRLYLETLLRRTPPTDSKIHLGHRGAIRPMPYQLVPALRALGEPMEGGQQCIRPRVLIADGTGLGKTIEVGILLSELIKRGRGRRILVVAIKSLLAQFQRDLWARFTIPLVRLDSEGIRRIQSKIPSNRNPFSYYDRCIISVDTLKNNGRYRAELEQIRWDVIVVDECQNVANRGTQRGSLAQLLAARCDSLVLTSATPHNGRPESFANLMRMLDPTAIADPQHFQREDIERLFVRRFKHDIEDQAGDAFQEREVHRHSSAASAAEHAALTALHEAQLHNLGRKRHGVDPLFRWTLIKAFLSSPHACIESIEHREQNTVKALTEGPEDHPHAKQLNADLKQLGSIKALVEAAAKPQAFTKLEELFAQLESIGFDGSAKSPRVVIFSERIRTLDLLKEEIAKRFKVKKPDEFIGVFEAQLPDVELTALKESFGREASPLRVLLASDAASEGVNLHYHCHQLFHFDIPWSLIRLTQRNGRIDRFGQKHTPHLHYLLTETKAVTADQQVVERLIEREKVVYTQLGDAGALLGLYDADAEDDFITGEIAKGRKAEDVVPDKPLAVLSPPEEAGDETTEADVAATSAPVPIAKKSAGKAKAAPKPEVDPSQIDLFALLDGDAPAEAVEEAAPAEPTTPAAEAPEVDIRAMLEESRAAQRAAPPPKDAEAGLPSLFAGDYQLVVTALQQLKDHPLFKDEVRFEKHDPDEALTLWPPASFEQFRAEFLPQEALPADNQPFQLVAKRERVQEKINQALESDDGAWPGWHLLWEQHPVVEWLLDTLGAAYARHEAPVLIAPALKAKKDEAQRALFLFNTLVSNEDSQPVHTAWFAIECLLPRGKEPAQVGVRTHDLAAVLELTGLNSGQLTNPHGAIKTLDELRHLVPQAVAAARDAVKQQREPALDELRKAARVETRRLHTWYMSSKKLLDQRTAKASANGTKRVPSHIQEKLDREREELERFKQNHEQWLKSLTAHGAPYVRLAAVFTGA